MLLYLIRQWGRRSKTTAPLQRPLRATLFSNAQQRFAGAMSKLSPVQQKIALLVFLLLAGSFFILNLVTRLGGRTRNTPAPAKMITPALPRHRDTASLETIWRHLQLPQDSNHFQQQHHDTTKAFRKK